jgi:hypothetical protein
VEIPIHLFKNRWYKDVVNWRLAGCKNGWNADQKKENET